MSQYYIPIANKKIKSVPLAFTVPDNLPPAIVTGVTLAWTKSALRELGEIQKATRSPGRVLRRSRSKAPIKELPYASLRGILQVGLKKAERIEPHVGLKRSILNNTEPQPFAYLSDTDEVTVQKVLRPILNEWLTKELRPFASKAGASEDSIDRLEDFLEKGQLLTIAPFKYRVLPWPWNKETGTTQGKNYAYYSLVDYAVRRLAGQEIFAGLGPMKRIVSSGGGLKSAQAELITDPISMPEGKVSLVVTLEVVTFPSLHQPLLTIDVSKKRWMNELDDPGFDRGNITGFVFSQDYEDRVFSFQVTSQKDDQKKDDKKKYCWKPDKGFEALRRELKLPMQAFSGPEIALGHANTESCQLTLTYRNGLGSHKIDVGVPEVDRLEAFDAIANILQPVGIVPFEDYKPVKNPNKGYNKEASREINLPTLLGAILEQGQTNSLELTPKYLEQLDDSELDAALKQKFDFSITEIKAERKALKGESQIKELKTLIQENRNALQRLYPNERLLLIIFYEEQTQTEIKLLKAIITLLWGESIEVLVNRLPEDTHGPQNELAGEGLSNQKRSELRIEQWKPMAQELKKRDRRTFCLVMASKWYQIAEEKYQHDDRINKPSTRQALASMAGSCVQFLVPMSKDKSNHLDLGDFCRKVQKSLQELLSAHSGRIDNVKTKVEKCLKGIKPDARPKEIIGITIVRKQKGRSRGWIEDTFLAIAIRLNVETGQCDMCCGYEKGNQLKTSDWNFFPDALSCVSQISPVKLGDKRDIQKSRFTDFVKKVISSSVKEEKQPLVIIDSSNCVYLWPWLADVRINVNEINLGSHQWMEQEWKGARLIRVRQELAPGIIDLKERHLIETYLEDTRSKEELKQLPPDLRMPYPSSPTTGLFRLNATSSTGCVAYLSVGAKSLPKNKKGQSCYRSTKINTSAKVDSEIIKLRLNNLPIISLLIREIDCMAGILFMREYFHTSAKVYNAAKLNVEKLAELQPFIKQWPTPNPLEIVVTLRQPEDNPDELAALVESLRYGFGHYGESTGLPAPLFFERVVRDYISQFFIDDIEEEDEENVDGEE